MKVEYIEHLGSDLTVVNAARVSFDKHTETLTDKDERLIQYLAKHNHWTPFAHPQIQLRLTVPIFIANQLKRHQIGFALNEVSRRYVDDDPKFFVPEQWRGRPDGSIKQGSSEAVIKNIGFNPRWPWLNQTVEYEDLLMLNQAYYTHLIQIGVAPEMARMILPQSMYTSWYWTGSLAAWARLCQQRLDAHAQVESQQIAQQISDIIQPLFPISWTVLVNNRNMER